MVVLPDPVGPVTRMMPSLADSRLRIARLLLRVHAERVQAQHGGALAQHPDDDLLAQRGRQGRDAEVHRLAVHRDPGAAVLRPEPVGDVESGHDLDAGDQRQPGVARDLHHLPQHAVDAVAHHHAALDRLDVDVARPAGDPVGEHDVHQPDDRAAGSASSALAAASSSSSSSLTSKLPPIPSSSRFTASSPRYISSMPLPDRGRGAEQHPDFSPGRERQHLLGVDVERVGGRHLEEGIGLAAPARR